MGIVAYLDHQRECLIGFLQSVQKENSTEWMEKAAALLTECTGQAHYVATDQYDVTEIRRVEMKGGSKCSPN